MRCTLALAVLLLPGAATAQTSFYTELRGETCTITQVHQEFQCPAPPGFGVRLNVGGRSELLTLRLSPRSVFNVAPPQAEVMPGQTGAGDRLEWRADAPRARPYALIMRRTEDRRSRLEVYRVGTERLCWLGTASGADANARARSIADQGRNTPCG